ncbi:MAG: CHAT domain-containing protein [Anaerolineae bacterium]|nr:CHAT domain-containing protein [Anaerolineae bacterium]
MRASRDFADLELRLYSLHDGYYPVDLTLNHEQQFGPGRLDPALPDLDGAPAQVGQALFSWLFADPMLQKAWAEIRGQYAQRRVRLRIDIDAPELHALPWELLREADVDLSAALATPFSRYLTDKSPPGSPILQRPIKILVAIAAPEDLAQSKYNLAPINPDIEWAALQTATAELREQGQVTLIRLPQPCTLQAIDAALKESGAHILHFIGHGAFIKQQSQAILFLADEHNAVITVPDTEVAAMLARQLADTDTRREDKLRLVFLSSCQTATRSQSDAFHGLAPQLVAAGVPAVVAMQDFVAIESARAFSRTFYQKLLASGQVDLACNEARSALLNARKKDAAVPALFMRLRDGALLGQRGLVAKEKQDNFWGFLLESIAAKECVVFLGPRVNSGLLPNSAAVAHRLLTNISYPLPRETHDLARVARYLTLFKDEKKLRREYVMALREGLLSTLEAAAETRAAYQTANLTKTIAGIDWAETVRHVSETTVYHLLADLPIPLYLTTNIDNFMVEVLSHKAGCTPQRMGLRWQQTEQGSPEDVAPVKLTAAKPIVLHLNGHDGNKEQLENIVLSEDDYLEQLIRLHTRPHELLPANVNTALTKHSLLFLGYSLDDWEFRVIWQGLLKTITPKAKVNVGVQLDLDPQAKPDNVLDYLQKYMNSRFQIDVYWGTAQQFVAELHHEWQQVKNQIVIFEEESDDDGFY